MSNMYGRGIKGKATKLHALVVRQRGACEHCGSRDNLQCAHIVTRARNATRCDPANAFCLCAGCHLRFTHWPLEFADFVVDKIGRDAYEALVLRSNTPIKANDGFWQDWIDLLETMKDTA